MDPVDIYNVVRDHVANGKLQHPDIKPLDSYPILIREWATKLENALSITGPNERNRLAGRVILQLAGMCIRGVEENDLPLTPPKVTV